MADEDAPLAELRSVCAALWNPIGVPMQLAGCTSGDASSLLPADEYDSYLIAIWRMTVEGRSAADLLHYLSSVERTTMGLLSSSGDKGAFIAALQQR